MIYILAKHLLLVKVVGAKSVAVQIAVTLLTEDGQKGGKTKYLSI